MASTYVWVALEGVKENGGSEAVSRLSVSILCISWV